MVVELGGIEPPSVWWELSALRPFPSQWLTATTPPGRLRPKPRRRIFLRCQRSFPSSAFFQAVTLRFCCRAAESWPRAPLLVTISLYRLSDQAARVNCSSAVDFVPPFKESEATPVARSSLRSRRRNRSAPDRLCSVADNGVARNVSRFM